MLAIGLAAFALSSHGAPPPFDQSRATHLFDSPGGVNILLAGSGNSAPQHRAHLSMLVALALSIAIAHFGVRRRRVLPLAFFERRASAILAILLGVLLWLQLQQPPSGFEFTGVVGRSADYGLGVLVTVVLWVLGRRGTSRGSSRICLALVFAMLVGLMLPGFWRPLDLSQCSWWDIEDWQSHYDIVLGPADRLAHTQHLGEARYGPLLPVVLAAFRLEAWTFGDYVRLSQIMQIVVFALLLPAYSAHVHGRWLLGLLAMTFVALDYHFNTYLLGYPNLMGLRFLGFPVAFLGLLVTHRMHSARTALVLGATAGFCLLYNVETGIAVTAGLFACVMLRAARERSRLAWGERLGVGGFFLCGLAAAVVAFLLVARVSLGRWLDPEEMLAAPRFLLLSRSLGLGGGTPTFDLLPVAMFGHASAVWIATSIQARPLALRGQMRILAATICLLWFAYYAHRPNAAYFSSLLVPYSFLLMDTLRAVIVGRRSSLVGYWRLALPMVVLSAAVIPYVAMTTRVQAPLYLEGLERAALGPPPRAMLVSGVYLPDDARTRRILRRSAFLRRQPASSTWTYITADTFLVAKLSGAWPDLPVTNVFWESPNAERYAALIRAMVAGEYERIYFDSWAHMPPEQVASTGELWRFHRQLRQDLSHAFVFRRRVEGWEEWIRRPHGPSS